MGLCFPLCPASTGEVSSLLLKDTSGDPVTKWPLCKWEREFLLRWKMEDDWSPPQDNRWEDNKSIHKSVFPGTWSSVHSLILLICWAADHSVLLQPLSARHRVSTWERALQLGCKKCSPQKYTLCTVLCEQRKSDERMGDIYRLTVHCKQIWKKYGVCHLDYVKVWKWLNNAQRCFSWEKLRGVLSQGRALKGATWLEPRGESDFG